MTNHTNPLTTAQILWKTDDFGNVVPTSTAFDDIYFSNAGGLDETQYVFMDGNNLPARFANCMKNNTNFVIGETGFGTGLNFLCACLNWQTAWQDFQTTNPNATPPILHFISTEKYPLSQNDLTTTLAVWRQKIPALADWIDALLVNYPLPFLGGHRRYLTVNGLTVRLDLWLGDATDSFKILKNQSLVTNQFPKINAWLLDGFAPKKNESLWNDELFHLIKDLSANGTTFATFTAAGQVRRSLLGIGASVQKIKGFGKKREMLVGEFFDNKNNNLNDNPPKTALIIGAGISGLSIAYALALRGVSVTIVDKTAPLAGASGNLRALFCPKLGAFATAHTHLPTASYLYAEPFYREFAKTSHQVFAQTGAVDMLLPTQKSNDKLSGLISDYPIDFIYKINEIDGKFASFLPSAGLISPHALCQAILNHPNINYQTAQIHHLSDTNGQAIASTDIGELIADIAIVSAGFLSHTLTPVFDGRKIRGQVSWTSDKQAINDFNHAPFWQNKEQNIIQNAIKYDGYGASFWQNDENFLLFGASFVRNNTDTSVSDDEHAFNLEKLSAIFPSVAKHLSANKLSGRASIRSQTPDYHPIVGKITPSVYVMSAMGSKGFSFAPLCGEILASMIFGEFLPVGDEILKAIDPNRERLKVPLKDNV